MRHGWVLLTLTACAASPPCPTGPSQSISVDTREAKLDASAVKVIVERDLRDSAAAWNRGDLDTFVTSYAEDAVFVSPSGITEGRAAVLARYRKKYGEAPETMGRLSLEVIDLRPATRDDGTVVGMAVVGHWRVRWAGREAPDDVAEGHTLLVYRPGPDGRWRIVHDASM